MHRGPRFLGSKFLYSTVSPDVAIVELKSILGALAGNAIKTFVVDRNDPNSVSEAEVNLTLNVMVRDLQNGRADRARDEMLWWAGRRGVFSTRPEPSERYEPAARF